MSAIGAVGGGGGGGQNAHEETSSSGRRDTVIREGRDIFVDVPLTSIDHDLLGAVGKNCLDGGITELIDHGRGGCSLAW